MRPVFLGQSCKLLSWNFTGLTIAIIFQMSQNVELVQPAQWQLHELMLILPLHLTFHEPLRVHRRRWRIRYFSDKVSCRSLCNAINKDTQQRDLQESVKSDPKAKENTLPVPEPLSFLLFGEPDSEEIWLQLDEALRQRRDELL